MTPFDLLKFRFFVGIPDPSMGWPLSLRGFRVCLSANRLRGRAGEIPFVGCDGEWMLDSGAFTQVALKGGFEQSPRDYARMIRRYAPTNLVMASSQDFMCEAFVLRVTGRTVAQHQAMTIERYDDILHHDVGGVHLMPVLQGWTADDYRRHLDQNGSRLRRGMRVGVGSVCKRQGDPAALLAILAAIRAERPDLRLHGFGCKRTALLHGEVRGHLTTADSMAWSFAARFDGRDQNDWMEAVRYALGVGGCPEAVEILTRAALRRDERAQTALAA